MATTFNSFSNILPDPANPISDAGAVDGGGNYGPGFASITLQSIKDTQVARTISGRGVTRESGSHNWQISIKYNPMLREQFDPVDAFLEARNSRLYPFFVILPQYAKPKDPTFASFTNSNVISVVGNVLAGASYMMVDASSTILGNPRPGDMFTITDPTNVNHMKAYKITRVESGNYYQNGSTVPLANQRRIWFNPPLQRNTADNSVVNFNNPKFRVIQTTDTLSYDLNTDNLYTFSLELEEIQP